MTTEKPTVMDHFRRQFFAGLVIFVPISLTVYFIRFVFLLVSQSLLPLFLEMPELEQHPALRRPLSFILTIFLIWLLGVIASNIIGKRLVGWLEAGIRRIPFFRGLYEAIQKVTEAFFGAHPIYRSVVLVEYPRRDIYTFGFVTSEIPGSVFHSTEVHLCVFVPTVPNPTSGLLLYFRKSETIPVSLSIEEVAKILVSHGFLPIPENAVRR